MRKALVEMSADRVRGHHRAGALYYARGPMANIPVYCERKLGRDAGNEKNWYPHEKLEPILAETFGIIVYQEQVMEVAKVLAGYSLGDADLLRRAMGKKIKAEMDAQRDRFVKGAVERGLDKGKGQRDLRPLWPSSPITASTSRTQAAYALITYQTAYLKANYPVEFMAASMSLDIDNTDKLAELRQDAQRLGIKVEPPNVNRSGVVFEVHDGAIRYALAAIKGVGRAAVEAIVQARGDTPFRSRRLRPAPQPEAGQQAHAGKPRRRRRPRRDRARPGQGLCRRRADDAARQGAAEAETVGMMDMFGGVAAAEVALRIPAYENWPMADRLKREYDAVGFFLSGHPLDEYGDLLQKLRVQTWAEFCRSVRAGTSTVGRVAASVLDRAERRTKTGNKLGIVTLSDQTAISRRSSFPKASRITATCWKPAPPWCSCSRPAPRARTFRAPHPDLRTPRPGRRPPPEGHADLPARRAPDLQRAAAVAGERGGGGVADPDPRWGRAGGGGEAGGKYQATPQIAGALRAVPGVVQVEGVEGRFCVRSQKGPYW